MLSSSSSSSAHRLSARSSTTASLGEREREVLGVLWAEGNATVHQVAQRLHTTLAYTTVMTTLDRLFKKGLVSREKQNRAFVYTPALTPDDLERDRASALIHRFFSGSQADHDILLSCLVNAVERYDTALLQRLEERVRIAKKQIPAGRNGKNEVPR